MRNFNWFIILLIISIVVRLYLVLFTEGSFDVHVWETHATNILNLGLSGYYKSEIAKVTVFNHPPFIGKLISSIYLLCDYTGIPFKILFRLLLTSLDYVIAYYLYIIFCNNKHKRLVVAFYLMNPLTIIFSAYHGNTDTCIGLFILLSVYFISRKNLIAAGIALGTGIWIKWIILIVLPPLFFALPEFSKKMKYTAAVFLTGFIGYAWQLFDEPTAMLYSVFGYKGQLIQTTAGIPVWGNRIIFDWLFRLFNYKEGTNLINYLLYYNQLIVVVLVIVYSWLQRQRTDVMGIGRTVGEVFIIFYATTNFWSFQYFVWFTPFLCFLSLPLLLLATIPCSAYIYALYSLVCGSMLLLGTWDFIGHPLLSEPVLALRNLSIISFMIMTVYLFLNALFQEQSLSKSS